MSETTGTRNLVTAYQAAKIINQILSENGYKEIPPQMVYQYVVKGYIFSYETGQINTRTGKPVYMVDLDGNNVSTKNPSHGDFGPWMVQYLAKRGITFDTTTVRDDTSELQSATRG